MADDKKQPKSYAPIKVGSISVLNSNAGITADLTKMNKGDVIKTMWEMDPTSAKNVVNISAIYTTPYGICRSVPIICRKDDCPYADVCMVPANERIKGKRCPMEIATIVSRFSQWCEHFEINIVDDTIDPKDMVDATLIKDLVAIEVQQIRAENKMAMNGDFVAETLLDIDRKCQAYYGEAISKEAEYLIMLQQRKDKILSQLNATRKDKAANKNDNSPSDEAMKIFTKLKNLERESAQHGMGSVSDVQFDDDGNIIQEVQPDVIIEEQEEQLETKVDTGVDDSSEWNNINLAEE